LLRQTGTAPSEIGATQPIFDRFPAPRGAVGGCESPTAKEDVVVVVPGAGIEIWLRRWERARFSGALRQSPLTARRRRCNAGAKSPI